MATVEFKHSKTEMPYLELAQQNAVRWFQLKEVSPDNYVTVSGKWKCKDFMNDAVVGYHKDVVFKIYGFLTRPENFNKESNHFPLLVELNGVNKETFLDNLVIVNEWLMSQDCEIVSAEVIDPQYVLIKLPMQALHSTYFMSMYTLLVRCAHNKKVCNSFEELFNNSCRQDKGLLSTLKVKPPSVLNEKDYDYIVRTSSKEYSVRHDAVLKVVDYPGCIHNCGIVEWYTEKGGLTAVEEDEFTEDELVYFDEEEYSDAL